MISLQATECRFTIDHKVVDMIDNMAVNGIYQKVGSSNTMTLQTPADAITVWNAAIGSGQEWVNKMALLYGNIYQKAA